VVSEDYEQWLSRGLAHQKAGRPIDAMVCYRRALKSNAYSVQAHFQLGEVLHALGREEEATAAWVAGLALAPAHPGLLLRVAGAARRAGKHAEATEGFQRALAADPGNRTARAMLALARIETGDAAAFAELAGPLTDDSFVSWEEVARGLLQTKSSAAKTALLRDLAAARGDEMPPQLLALAAHELIAAGERTWGEKLLARAETLAPRLEDLETLRLLALGAAHLGNPAIWAERYAQRCATRFGSGGAFLWPRRTAGAALRVAYLVAPGVPIEIGASRIPPAAYMRAIVAAHPRERFATVVYLVAAESLRHGEELARAGVPVRMLGALPEPTMARAVAQADADAVIDLVGLKAPLGPLLAQKLGRTQWTYDGLVGANAAPLITERLSPPAAATDEALASHRLEVEAALQAKCVNAPWFTTTATRSAPALEDEWRGAVAAHQRGDRGQAIEGYRAVLEEQPAYAPAQYLLGVALRELGDLSGAREALEAAVGNAPGHAEAGAALAGVYRLMGRPEMAAKQCRKGLRLAPDAVSLWREFGLARLARRLGGRARRAFAQALTLAPNDAETHYNEGVALQMQHRRGSALRAYQRALALDPTLIAADFNIGVILRERGRPEEAVKAFEQVLARDPRNVAAHKALAETLFGMRRIDEWFAAFDRFEAACANALPLAVLALQVCQYRADFARLDRYLDRIANDEFKPTSEGELADCLEELLFLLLYFDFDPEAQFGLYKAYDAVAPNVYGHPRPQPARRKPGPIRVGYLSGDLRNHVMGKMMWSAIGRHDRRRFELFLYSLSSEEDEWTARYRGLGPNFTVVADLTETDAVKRINADQLDILVDLATNTRGAKPGILARKPARVQITHVASAGVVGLGTIAFKLTDAYADLPESQKTQLETLLPMEGCVYPYRHIAPAKEHPFHRDRLGISASAVVIGAFVNPLKLSRRCLALWREVLERIPNALLAVSPNSPEQRGVVARLLAAGGIAPARVCILPQGRNDAENQSRYTIVDFSLDPMPYGGANGTLEALDMNVPVVTLVGRRHGERSSYSILANLGVMQTVAESGSDYVAIAVRLATEPAFMAEVRAAIRAGLEHSALTDMDAHARHLEQAYLRALELAYPAALDATRHD
jgi:protein O-GlcNAc transferase